MQGTVILSHGLESGPGATKVSALAAVADALGWRSVRPDFRAIDASRDPRAIDARITHLLDATPDSGRLVFAGSSMGAFVSGFASLERACEGLFLLALPVAIEGYARTFDAAPVPTQMIHGWNDTLCPVEATTALARQRGDALNLVADDHRLGQHVEYCAQVFRRFLLSLP
jgi:alpha/beta superfamily hydrolase